MVYEILILASLDFFYLRSNGCRGSGIGHRHISYTQEILHDYSSTLRKKILFLKLGNFSVLHLFSFKALYKRWSCPTSKTNFFSKSATVLCREVFFFLPKITLFSITFFLQTQWCCNFLQSIDKCLIHSLGTYCMFLALGVILRVRKQKSFEKTKIFTEFGSKFFFPNS